MRLSPLVLLLGACGGGGDSPDAGAGTPDAPPIDASPCASTELCLAHEPIDGVTDVPPGRLVVAWFVIGGDAGDSYQIALDQPWAAAPLTHIALADLAAPDGSFYVSMPCGSTPADAAIAVAALIDDPDDSGDISVSELRVAGEAGWIYGIAQGIVLESPLGCATPTDELPSGILVGRHAYAGNEHTAFTPTGGAPVPFTTCAPMSPACGDLEGPI